MKKFTWALFSHYVLITIILFIAFFVGDKFGLAKWELWQMFIFWLAILIVADQIAEKLFKIS